MTTVTGPEPCSGSGRWRSRGWTPRRQPRPTLRAEVSVGGVLLLAPGAFHEHSHRAGRGSGPPTIAWRRRRVNNGLEGTPRSRSRASSTEILYPHQTKRRGERPGSAWLSLLGPPAIPGNLPAHRQSAVKKRLHGPACRVIPIGRGDGADQELCWHLSRESHRSTTFSCAKAEVGQNRATLRRPVGIRLSSRSPS